MPVDTTDKHFDLAAQFDSPHSPRSRSPHWLRSHRISTRHPPPEMLTIRMRRSGSHPCCTGNYPDHSRIPSGWLAWRNSWCGDCRCQLSGWSCSMAVGRLRVGRVHGRSSYQDGCWTTFDYSQRQFLQSPLRKHCARARWEPPKAKWIVVACCRLVEFLVGLLDWSVTLGVLVELSCLTAWEV